MSIWLQRAAKFARLVTKTRTRRPHEFQIEITNRCNLDCDMCPRLSVLGVPEVDMAEETFETILGRLVDPRAVTLTGWGEPLMHGRIFEFIDRIHERFPACEVSFTTNGYLLDEGRVEAILKRRIRRINVSLEELPWEQEAPPEPGLDPRKGHGNTVATGGHPARPHLITNLRRLIAAKREAAPKLELRLQAVMMPGGDGVLGRLVNFAGEEGFSSVNLVRLDLRDREDMTRPDFATERAMIALARQRAAKHGLEIHTVNDHGLLMRLAAHHDSFCLRLDDYVYINVHGEVAACCLLRNKPVGDLRESSLEEVWGGAAMTRFYGSTLPDDCAGCDAFLHRQLDPQLESPRARSLTV